MSTLGRVILPLCLTLSLFRSIPFLSCLIHSIDPLLIIIDFKRIHGNIRNTVDGAAVVGSFLFEN